LACKYGASEGAEDGAPTDDPDPGRYWDGEAMPPLRQYLLRLTKKKQMPSFPHPKELHSRTVAAFGLQIWDF
jgi:hypothetical protein